LAGKDYGCNISILTTNVSEDVLIMKNIPQISEAEWEVMKVFWLKSPMSSSEVVEMLEGKSSWKAKTIKTLISRLVQKNALSYKEEGRAYHYYPVVTQEECLKAESQILLYQTNVRI
jgi:BlaI family penicillinase repressor